MKFQTITAARDGACFVITFNRPERRNALNLALLEELGQALRLAAAEDAVRAVVLTGGGVCFSSGADLTEVKEIRTAADCAAYFGRWRTLCENLEALDKPVLAAIEGACFTGGCELALACDIRVAGHGASFAMTSARIGTVAGFGGTQRLPRLIGEARALELLFAAEPIDAEEAHRIGLVNRLTARGGALAEALRLGALYAERAPLSLAAMKQAVRRGLQMDLDQGLDLERALVTGIYASADKHEGIAAFLEKRPPRFTGR